ncbi:MAG: hypothetical protein AB8B65_13965 [Kordia sp.]|uniref:hypothetical protein n=1 Tax=Kordia sp. TaxID=1965332 RepID=UPI00385A8EF5
MKKRSIKTIKLNKSVISTLSTTGINGGFDRPIDNGTEISYCHVGSRVQCCA